MPLESASHDRCAGRPSSVRCRARRLAAVLSACCWRRFGLYCGVWVAPAAVAATGAAKGVAAVRVQQVCESEGSSAVEHAARGVQGLRQGVLPV